MRETCLELIDPNLNRLSDSVRASAKGKLMKFRLERSFVSLITEASCKMGFHDGSNSSGEVNVDHLMRGCGNGCENDVCVREREVGK